MRASVHVKIPHAAEHADFKKICDEYHIQVGIFLVCMELGIIDHFHK